MRESFMYRSTDTLCGNVRFVVNNAEYFPDRCDNVYVIAMGETKRPIGEFISIQADRDHLLRAIIWISFELS